ncbi:MAG: leucine-rich repeat protein [Lepagella sp.]
MIRNNATDRRARRNTPQILLTIGLVMFYAATSMGLNVDLTPGTLSEQWPKLKNCTDEMVVLTGSANVIDLVLLKEMSRNVKTLDMSGLKIVSYTYSDGDYLGLTDYAADEMPPYMLMGSSITKVIFPQEIKIIGQGAFADSDLTDVEIPATVSKIAAGAFSCCRSLQRVVISADATLGKGIFKECESLTTVEFNYGITSIPESMFEGCSKYSAVIPSSVTSVGAKAYRGTAAVELNLTMVENIGRFAFADMAALSGVTLSQTQYITMDMGAFFNDPQLLQLPTFSGDIPALMVANSQKAGDLMINQPMIGEAAYADSPNVTTLTLGANVNSIGANAFRNLTSLTLVDVVRKNNTPPTVDATSFSGLENEEGRYDVKLNVTKGTEETWSSHPVWGLFEVGNFDTGIQETLLGEVKINARRAGDSVIITSSEEIENIEIFGLNGTTLYQGRNAGKDARVEGIDTTDPVVVRIISGGVVKVLKLR